MEDLKKSFLVRGNNIVGFSDKNFSTAPIGTVLSFAGQTAHHGYLLCDGASYKVADYPDLYAVIGNTYGGDTENFNVPNLVDKFIQGSTTSGEEKEAGLPNITGGWMPSVPVNYQNYVAGAVTAETKSSGLVSSSGTQVAPGAGFKIDASKSSAVYGKSTTVQPPALTMVYIIKAFHTNEGVDSGVSDDVISYINNSNSYSTEETLTGGKWIDGKPIYRKVFKVLKSELERDESANTNRWYSPIFALSIDEIVNYDVLAFRNNGMVYKSVDYILNGSYSIVWTFSGFLFKNNSEIRIGSFMGDALYNDLSHIYGILYYTKS